MRGQPTLTGNCGERRICFSMPTYFNNTTNTTLCGIVMLYLLQILHYVVLLCCIFYKYYTMWYCYVLSVTWYHLFYQATLAKWIAWYCRLHNIAQFFNKIMIMVNIKLNWRFMFNYFILDDPYQVLQVFENKIPFSSSFLGYLLNYLMTVETFGFCNFKETNWRDACNKGITSLSWKSIFMKTLPTSIMLRNKL